MAQKIIAFFVFLFVLTPVSQAKIMQVLVDDITRFQQKMDFKVTGITTPKVVTYEMTNRLGRFVSLKNLTKNTVVNFSKKNVSTTPRWTLPVSETSTLIDANTGFIQDDNQSSYITFDANSDTKHVTFTNPGLWAPSALNLSLGANTSRPKSVTIEAILPGTSQWSVIVDKASFKNQLTFPQIQPKQIRVLFETNNLLRLSELEWTTTNRQSNHSTQISFWAEEGDEFTLFIQPSFGQKALSINSTNPIRTDSSTPLFTLPSSAPKNPVYNPDFDKDGLNDNHDLCPQVADSSNADLDSNGKGDVCEDPDQDRINSSLDNCPFVANRDQTDTDADGTGDACDDMVNQKSENSELWINLSFGLMILALLALIGRSAWPAIVNKK